MHEICLIYGMPRISKILIKIFSHSLLMSRWKEYNSHMISDSKVSIVVNILSSKMSLHHPRYTDSYQENGGSISPEKQFTLESNFLSLNFEMFFCHYKHNIITHTVGVKVLKI